MKIFIMGAGSWGTALAISLLNNGHDITLYMRRKEQLEEIENTGYNNRYLKEVVIPKEIKLTNNAEDAKNKDIVVLAVSSQASRMNMDAIKPYINDETIIVNVSKGLEKGSKLRASQISEQILPNNPFVVLSGPSHAEEVAKNVPTALVSASKDMEAAKLVQDVFSSEFLRVYTNNDVIGVELGGALKNIIALGVGIVDGLGYGDNTKAALMTRGIAEITRLGTEMGSEVSTFVGLSGIGDLIVTCTSMHSRNRRAGVLLGKGMELNSVLEQVGMVVEGIVATDVVKELSKQYDVEMPITNEIYALLYEGIKADEAVKRLMLRTKKNEVEDRLNIKME